jgi:hypothetical protein
MEEEAIKTLRTVGYTDLLDFMRKQTLYSTLANPINIGSFRYKTVENQLKAQKDGGQWKTIFSVN